MKKCHYCFEEVKEEAIKCKHCHSSFVRTPEQELKRNTNIVVLRLVKIVLLFHLSCFILYIVGSQIFIELEYRENQVKLQKIEERNKELAKQREKERKKQEYDKLIEERVEKEKQKIFEKYKYNGEEDLDCQIKHCKSYNKDIETIDY